MSAPDVCPDCGEVHDEPAGQDEFNERADAMFEALGDGGDPITEMALIAMAAARLLAGFDATFRKKVRRDLIKDIDGETQYLVISQCDA